MNAGPQVAIVTGAGGGIGRGVVRRYVADGMRVAAVDVNEKRVREIAAEFDAGTVLPVVADVASWTDNQHMVRETVESFGRLDVLVANAGIYDQAIALADLDGAQLSDGFDELFAVNVKSCLLGARAALQALLQTHGSIILTASFASFHPAGGGVLYTASKHAVLGLVRQLAYELAPDVRVNGVAPGVAPTTLGGVTSLHQQPQESILPGSERALPMGEIPTSDSYGGVFSLLASRQDAGHITGTVITADSGLGIRGIARPAGRSQPSPAAAETPA